MGKWADTGRRRVRRELTLQRKEALRLMKKHLRQCHGLSCPATLEEAIESHERAHEAKTPMVVHEHAERREGENAIKYARRIHGEGFYA